MEIIAEEQDVDPTSLPPLYDAIDPDHLERLIASAAVPVRIEFRYCGYDVIVDGDGNVTVADHSQDDPVTET